ncbi:hypothetical protein CcI49_11215 [Frankia sp. CcI49]|uniref:MmyB family transcriptional regulator n=1 Tax=Frankia sp. CcI49 TaxID=1745382 RepID=UPI0009789BF2|nr:hypothetical protein [Frankia sp. CcI49]ONH60611.1 hypothetical protein CcI49_11215 [Frankia sp. CcI49]
MSWSLVTRPSEPNVQMWTRSSANDRPVERVVNARLDILAWNRLAAALICDFAVLPPEHRNAVWLLFVDPATRRLYLDWPRVAGDAVAILRVASAANADRATTELVDNLSRTSSEFRAFWAQHEVHAKAHGIKAFRHPVVGPLTLRFETLGLSGDQQNMITYLPADAESAATLRLLAAWEEGRPAHDNAYTSDTGSSIDTLMRSPTSC